MEYSIDNGAKFSVSGKTLKKLLADASERLSKSSSSPRLDAEILLRCVTGFSRKDLICNLETEPTMFEEMRFLDLVERRVSGEPVAYITGSKEFFGIPIEVNPSVLVPRPETELLVEKGLQYLKGVDGKLRVLDLGCGSGCIAIALASELLKSGREFSVLAIDKSREALEVAGRNAARAGLVANIELRQSDWFSSLYEGVDEFDLIVSNPPYVGEGEEGLSLERGFEPRQALFAGPDGLSDLRKLLFSVADYLKDDGIFLCEIGAKQRSMIEELLGSNSTVAESLAVSFHQDLAGHDRVLECVIRK